MGISERELREVGDRLRGYRIDSVLTQVQLAKAAGISRSYLSDVEQGRANITLNVLYTLAACLSVTPADILGSTGPQ